MNVVSHNRLNFLNSGTQSSPPYFRQDDQHEAFVDNFCLFMDLEAQLMQLSTSGDQVSRQLQLDGTHRRESRLWVRTGINHHRICTDRPLLFHSHYITRDGHFVCPVQHQPLRFVHLQDARPKEPKRRPQAHLQQQARLRSQSKRRGCKRLRHLNTQWTRSLQLTGIYSRQVRSSSYSPSI